jgi:hypothetical protein
MKERLEVVVQRLFLALANGIASYLGDKMCLYMCIIWVMKSCLKMLLDG